MVYSFIFYFAHEMFPLSSALDLNLGVIVDHLLDLSKLFRQVGLIKQC